jgi:phosphoglycerate dehydrogenase-like enzyme
MSLERGLAQSTLTISTVPSRWARNVVATIRRGREMPTTTSTRIGFVGLGHMGGTMATRFLAAGYPVYGEERNRAHAQGLVHDGLQWRGTPREVAETAEVVITSLPDDRALDAVASGPDGILAGLDAENDLDRHEHGQPAR